MKNKVCLLTLASALGFSLCAGISNNRAPKPGVLEAITNESLFAEQAVVPTDTYYETQKLHSMSTLGNIEGVWDKYTGKNVKVAVIDNGIDMDHEDFVRADGTSVISNLSREYKYESGSVKYYTLDKYPTTLNHDSTNSHGTQVAGALCAAMNNVGTVGIAPNVELVVLKTPAYNINEVYHALDYCASIGVDVVNMSFVATDSTWSSYLSTKINALYEAGAIICAAAGNNNVSTSAYPAHMSHVTGVGALADNSTTEKASYSNYNSETEPGINNVDIAAPGTVYAPEDGGGYKQTQGTSFASPIVAGAAALLKEAYDEVDQDDFERIIMNTAQWMDDTYWTQNFGYGRLDVETLLGYAVQPTSVEITPESQTLYIGNSVQLTASILPEECTNKNVTYVTSDATVATVNASGLVTAMGVGTATITGYTQDETVFDTVEITVTDVEQHVTGVSIVEGASAEIELGGTLTLHASVLPADASNKEVLWIADDETIVSVDDNGVVTGLKLGTTNVSVLTIDGEFDASISITVSPVAVTSIKVSPTNATLKVGDYKTLSATLLPANAVQTVTWSSNNEDVATVNEYGKVTAVAKGSAVITATSVATPDKKAVCSITVTDSSSSGWILVQDAAQISAGDTVILAANSITGGITAGALTSGYLKSISGSTFSTDKSEITTVAANTVQFTVGGESGAWTIANGSNLMGSSAAKTMTSNSGVTTWTMAFTSDGAATIQNTTTSYGKIQYNSGSPRFTTYTSSQTAVQLYVNAEKEIVAVTGVTLSASATNLEVGETLTVTPTIAPGNASNKAVTYTSADESIATVDGNGTVTAVAPGTVNITVTTDDGGYEDTVAVTVNPYPVLQRIYTSNVSTKAVVFGSTYDASAIKVTAIYDKGDSKDVTADATISLPNTKVLGDQMVDVTYQGKKCQYKVTVTNVGSSLEGRTASLSFTGVSSSSVTLSTTDSTLSLSSNSTTGTVAYENSAVKFASGSKSGSWTFTLNKNITITKITLDCVRYGSDNSTIKVNNVSQTAPTSRGDLEYTFDNVSTNSIAVSAASSNRFYLYGITITYAGSGSSTATFTAEEQATAWFNYFVAKTNNLCAEDGSTSAENVAALTTLWATFKTEYEEMKNDSKTAFVNAYEGSEMMARYDHIVARYELANFITDGEGTAHVVSTNPFASYKETTTSTAVVAVIGLLTVAGVALTLKKRKEN